MHVKASNIDETFMWEVHRPFDLELNRLRKPIVCTEYPAVTWNMKPDFEFEGFCRSTPGVTDVTFFTDSYCVSVQSSDWYPVQRLIYRWMQANERRFNVSWGSDRNKSPSTYDSLDRAISSLTYVHRPENWE